MIHSKKDLNKYLHLDSIRFKPFLGRGFRFYIQLTPINDQSIIWNYIKYLRLSEYAINSHNFFLKIYYLWKLRHASYKTGFQIPPNVVGPGLCIFHWGMIIVNGDARIGSNATFQPNVVIGKNDKGGGSPIIGDNFYICSGAKVFGDITIGNNVRIGPNCCVYKNIPDNCIVVGDPAYIVRKDGDKCKIKL